MAWSTTPPGLPAGSGYASVGSWNTTKNKYSTAGTVAIARLAADRASIRFVLNTNAGSTGTFAPPGYMDFRVGDSTKSYGWGANLSVTAYWTGTLSRDAAVAVMAGAHDSGAVFSHATYLSKNARGPAYVTKYTVTYHANNGSGWSDTQSKTWGSSVNLYTTSWTKEGHVFLEWNTAADGSGTGYAAEEPYTAEADLTVYAIWAPNGFTVSYDANGGTGATESQVKTHGADLTLRANGFTPPAGKHFLEWNTAPDGSGTAYEAGGTYTANAAVTLYAVWAPDTYAVSFDGNGADGGSQSSLTKTFGRRLVLPSCGFTRSGYAFAQWNTAPDAAGTGYAAGGYYETNAPATLYAIWTKNSIPVYLNLGGTIRQSDKVYRNTGGEILECEVYMNVRGHICPVR